MEFTMSDGVGNAVADMGELETGTMGRDAEEALGMGYSRG
jgi:hypothetical protein